MKKIGIIAEPFGYGPSSKACVIVNKLKEIIDFDLFINSDTVTQDFFNKENIIYGEFKPDEDYDLIINVLAPQRIESYIRRDIPTMYIDSLGFMWDKKIFEKFPALNNVDCYVVQDVFNSFQKLETLLDNPEILESVGAIVHSSNVELKKKSYNYIFQLGGMYNPINSNPVEDYYNLVQGILADFVSEDCMIMSSTYAKPFFEKRFLFKTSKHTEAINYLAQANKVITSPGLTTLLELSSIGKEFALFPPQNMSQLFILRNLAKQINNNAIEYLLSFYPKKSFSSEKEGVKYVSEINRQLSENKEFIRKYIQLLRTENFCFRYTKNYDGADRCAEVATNLIL